MAYIDNELEIIKTEPKGEAVRAAIIRAIQLIYNDREYKATTKKFTYNTGPEGETGGPWDKVIVEVPDGGVDVKNIDNCGTITENGYYTIKDLINIGLVSNPNCIGIDGFSVNVGQTTGQYGEINITENGTYDPLLDGYDGYSKVYVNVLGGQYKDYYTVTFYDGNRAIESVKTAHGANATCSPEGLAKLSGGNFVGWNPNPISVSRDMNCYAVYNSGGGTGAGDYTETIYDTWEQIAIKMKQGGQPYPTGSTKFLRLRGYGGVEKVLNMMLVSYTLDTNRNKKGVSTWININPNVAVFEASNVTTQNSIFGKFTSFSGSMASAITRLNGETIWWGNSLARAIFNGDPKILAYTSATGDERNDQTYFASLQSLGLLLPNVIDAAAGTNLMDRIEEVQKVSYRQSFASAASQATPYNFKDQPTTDKIWIPSTRELCFPLASGVATLPNSMCTQGPYYGNPNRWSESIHRNNHTGINFASRDMGYATNVNVHYNAMINVYGNSTGPNVDKAYVNSNGSAVTAAMNFNIGFCL